MESMTIATLECPYTLVRTTSNIVHVGCQHCRPNSNVGVTCTGCSGNGSAGRHVFQSFITGSIPTKADGQPNATIMMAINANVIWLLYHGVVGLTISLRFISSDDRLGDKSM
jgi:hypothetical protein